MPFSRASRGLRERMSTASKIAVGVASGYLLGRTKKLKLAITVGSMLAGQRISTSPQGLLKQGQELLDKNPELQKLQEQITGRLFDAAKSAALTTATSRLELLSSSLRGGGGGGDDADEAEDEPEDEYEDEESEEESEEEPEDEPEDEYDEPEDEAEEEEPEAEEEEEPEAEETRPRTSYEAEEEPEDEAEEEPEARGGARG